MRTFDSSTMATDAARRCPTGIAVFETVQVVAPGASSQVDRRAEMELAFVVGGSALVEVASRIERVREGGGVAFESMETHVLHNDSPDTSLVVVVARWMPVAAGRVPQLEDLAAAATRFDLAS